MDIRCVLTLGPERLKKLFFKKQNIMIKITYCFNLSAVFKNTFLFIEKKVFLCIDFGAIIS